MSAKPSTVPLWATSPTFAGGPTAGAANKVAPSSGARAEGYWPGQKPTAEVLNHEANLVGQWCQYLSDGDLDGDHSIDGALDVTGAITTDSLDVTADAEVGGDLDVVGDLSVGGRIGHGDRPLHIGAASFVCDSGFGSLSQLGYLSATGGVAIAYAAIPLPAGKRIRTVTVYYDRNGAGAVQPKLQRMSPSTGTIATIWTGANDGTGSGIESQSNAPDHEMLATDVYWIAVSLTASGNRLYGAIVVYDEVVP